MSMKTRDKLLIFISVIACCVAIAAFALVSLGHFVNTPHKATLPLVDTVSGDNVQEIAALSTVPNDSSNDDTTPPQSKHHARHHNHSDDTNRQGDN